jgi:DNA gyrase inhibitor GyrI
MFNAEKLNTLVSSAGQGLGKFELAADNSYIRFFGNGSGSAMDAYVTTGIESQIVSGQYAVLKYRIPTNNPETTYKINYFTSTTAASPSGKGDYVVADLIKDGEWHVIVLNLAKYGLTSFEATNGTYKAKFIRIDFLNQKMAESSYLDIAYFAMSDNLDDICLLNRDVPKLNYTDTPGEFKILLSETAEFEKAEVVDTTSPNDYLADMLNVYISPVDIFNCTGSSKGVGHKELREENAYVRIFGDGKSGEGNMVIYSNGSVESGKYFVIKYRLPVSNVEATNILEIFSSTSNASARGTDVAQIKNIIKDGEWHTIIVDITSYSTSTTFKPASDGTYTAKYLRFDFFDRVMSIDSYIDIAFVGICSDPEEISIEANKN